LATFPEKGIVLVIRGVFMKSIFLKAMLASCLLSLSVLATTAKPQFGYINYDKALAKISQAQRYLSQLEAQEKALLADWQKRSMEFEAKRNTHLEAKKLLNPEKQQEEETKLAAEYGAMQQEFNRRNAQLVQERQERSKEIEAKIITFTEPVATKMALIAVFNAATIVYGQKDGIVDVTDAVVELYNKTVPAPVIAPVSSPAPVIAPVSSPAPVIAPVSPTPAPTKAPAKKK
jgi:Skp family chaperone for outer membrane proteins